MIQLQWSSFVIFLNNINWNIIAYFVHWASSVSLGTCIILILCYTTVNKWSFLTIFIIFHVNCQSWTTYLRSWWVLAMKIFSHSVVLCSLCSRSWHLCLLKRNRFIRKKQSRCSSKTTDHLKCALSAVTLKPQNKIIK